MNSYCVTEEAKWEDQGTKQIATEKKKKKASIPWVKGRKGKFEIIKT